jgi:hypothetical protein
MSRWVWTLLRRLAAVIFILSIGLIGAGKPAAAQNYHPRDEIFGGYSVLFPNGWEELDYKANTIPNAFDASNTWYFCKFCGLGLILDGSGHFRGSTTPPNLANGSSDSTAVGYALAGMQYKWHHQKLSPFVRGLVGAASISPDCCHGTQWRFAAGGGGGLDLALSQHWSWRIVQADYLYSSYPHIFYSTHPTTWNSVRLATGLVYSFGTNTSPNCNPQPKACVVTAGSSTEVMAGEPVRFTVAGSNFNPKHTLNYGWKSTGGKLSSSNTAATEIDTTGMSAGSYSAVATVSDPKQNNNGAATCTTAFVVKTPPPPIPPTVKCVPAETTINAGESATLTMVATNPDNRPLTYTWKTTSGQLSPSGGSASLTPRNNDAGNTIAVTGTVADDRNLTATCNVTVKVPPLPPPCVQPDVWGKCTFELNPNLPARVDNACKDVLDKLALDIQGKTTGKLVIVGSAVDPSKNATLGAQRAENAKYYLTTGGPTKIDSDRIETRQGGSQTDIVWFYYVPEGTLCSGHSELGSAVDETTIKGHPRGKLPPHKKKVETGQ